LYHNSESGVNTTEKQKNEIKDHKADLTVSSAYASARNEIIQPNKILVTTRYFIRRWMPLLGDNGTRIVLALRSLGFYDRRNGEVRDGIEIDLPELALLIGISVATIKREFGEKHDAKRQPIPGTLKNEALHKFVKRDRQYSREPVTQRLLRTANVYRVLMDDPLHDDDLPRLHEILDSREKGGLPSRAHIAPKPPKGREPSKAQCDSISNESDSVLIESESKSNESRPENVQCAPSLKKDFSIPLKLEKTLYDAADAAKEIPESFDSLLEEEDQDKKDQENNEPDKKEPEMPGNKEMPRSLVRASTTRLDALTGVGALMPSALPQTITEDVSVAIENDRPAAPKKVIWDDLPEEQKEPWLNLARAEFAVKNPGSIIQKGILTVRARNLHRLHISNLHRLHISNVQRVRKHSEEVFVGANA